MLVDRIGWIIMPSLDCGGCAAEWRGGLVGESELCCLLAQWLGKQRFYRLSIAAPELDTREFRIAEDAKVATEPVMDLSYGITNDCQKNRQELPCAKRATANCREPL
jgi:hypothetical protein